MILTACNDDNMVWEEGLRNRPVNHVEDVVVRNGSFWIVKKVLVTDTVYEGSYKWIGVTEDAANAKVKSLYEHFGTIGGDGHTGLLLKVTIPEISGDPATIDYVEKQITMGSAAASPVEGRLWQVSVGINYTIKRAELMNG